jgi:hypothetical protein
MGVAERTRLLVAVSHGAKEVVAIMVDGDLARLDVEADPRLTWYLPDGGRGLPPGLMIWEGDVSRGDVRDGAGKVNGIIWRGALRPLADFEWKRLARGEPPWGATRASTKEMA